MKLEFIKSKCLEANPDIESTEILYSCNRVWEAWNIGTMSESDFEEVDYEYTLADVLMATQKKSKEDLAIDEYGDFMLNDGVDGYDYPEGIPNWDLTQTLDNQSEETINFLAMILGFDNLLRKEVGRNLYSL